MVKKIITIFAVIILSLISLSILLSLMPQDSFVFQFIDGIINGRQISNIHTDVNNRPVIDMIFDYISSIWNLIVDISNTREFDWSLNIMSIIVVCSTIVVILELTTKIFTKSLGWK